MASKNKIKKLKNSYLSGSGLKNGERRIKRLFFYTATQRKISKSIPTD